ncbi:MAG: ArnT family glycosyltransferase [Phototrophicaceae bacterium]
MRSRWFWSLLLIILVFTLAVRVNLADHRLPQMQVGDENSDLSNAVRMLNGEWRGFWHTRLGITYFNMLSVGGLFLQQRLSGAVHSLSAFSELYFAERWRFTLATRLMMAVLSTATVGVVVWVGRAIKPRVGLLAGVMLSLNGFFLLNSVYALPDPVGAFASALTLLIAVWLWRNPRPIWYFVAGLAMSFTAVAKLNALPISIAYLVGHAFATHRSHPTPRAWAQALFTPKLLLIGVGAIIGFLLLDPFAVLDTAYFLNELDFFVNFAYGDSNPTLIQQLNAISRNVLEMIRMAWRSLLPLTLLGGVACWKYRKVAPYWMILVASVTLFGFTANVTTANYKIFYWIPWLITAVLLSAVGVDALLDWARHPLARYAVYGLIGVVLAREASYLFYLGKLIDAQDTRQLAFAYIQEHWEENAKIMLGDPIAYSVPLQRNLASIERATALGMAPLSSWQWYLSLPEADRPTPTYDLYAHEMQKQIETYADVAQLIDQEQIQYVIELSYCETTADHNPASDSAIEYPPLDATLRASFEQVAVFHPFDSQTCVSEVDDRNGLSNSYGIPHQVHLGPVVTLYRVGATE